MSNAVHMGLVGVTNFSERLMVARFQMMGNTLHVFSAYAPTEAALSTEKDAFYDALQKATDQVPRWDTMVLVGDFNAQLGGKSSDIWQGHLGKFVLPKDKTTDGQRLLTSCVANGLVVRSTFFRHPRRLRVTRTGMDGTWQHQIDHVLMRRSDAQQMTDCRVYWGTMVESDHNLVVASFKRLGKVKNMQSKRPITLKQDLEALTADAGVGDKFEKCLSNFLAAAPNSQDVEGLWDNLRDAVQQASHAALQIGARKCNKWMTAETLATIDVKSAAWQKLRLALKRPQSIHHGAMSENTRPTAGAHEKRLQEKGKGLLKVLRKETRPGEKNSCGSPPERNDDGILSCRRLPDYLTTGYEKFTSKFTIYNLQKAVVRRLVNRDKSAYWQATAEQLQEAHRKGNLRHAYQLMNVEYKQQVSRKMPDSIRVAGGAATEGHGSFSTKKGIFLPAAQCAARRSG